MSAAQSHPRKRAWLGLNLIRFGMGIILCLLSVIGFKASGADTVDAQKLFLEGRYTEAADAARELMRNRRYDEDGQILLARALLITGHYNEAEATITNALSTFPDRIRIRLAGYEVLRQNGKTKEAKDLLDEINQLGSTRGWQYRRPPDLVALGSAALLLGADPKLVLENFFNEAKRSDPTLKEAYLAAGNLSLDKNDFRLAAKSFEEGLKKFPDDPDMHYGLAKAYAPDDAKKLAKHLEAAFEENPNHIPGLLLMADHLIDAEDYKTAEETLGKVLQVNPSNPEAWAYRAVIARLQNAPEQEQKAKDEALRVWKTNPEVTFLIGQKLSQKYRFSEGSAFQRQALTWDPDYLAAKNQLSQDLLRLGQDEEGWRLAEEVHDRDGYNVTAYNLVTLHETLSQFRTLKSDDFILRMHPHEAEIYGDEALHLLQQAKDTLTKKYGITLEQPTIVEIFPEQKDFAVRTFGMPGGEGYLGVCFGRLITANSPAGQMANPSNWKAVLWHEFCHVITLSMTKNKMPRWLSEGISVYEERQANRAWGQVMKPEYEVMILNKELTPISELSGAFLSPKTPMHLQFAYYESELVVEYLVEHYGQDAIKKILLDLAKGEAINPTIAAHTAPMKQLEKEFAAFVHKRAEEIAPGLEWKKPKNDQPEGDDLQWVAAHPNNYWVLTEHAKRLVEEKKWDQAKKALNKLIDEYPDQVDNDSAYVMLATVHRALNETSEERAALSKATILDADATEAYLRLMDLATASKDWGTVVANGERYLAVNPLLPAPYRYLTRAYEELGKDSEAIKDYRTLLQLDSGDQVDEHFRLARLLHRHGDPAAKRHVLQALEEAPRFRDAQKLLLEITRQPPAPDTKEK